MHTLLVVTVGGSPKPIVTSLLAAPRPARVLFVCSETSKALVTEPADRPPSADGVGHDGNRDARNEDGILAQANREGFSLGVGQYELIPVRHHERLSDCIEDLEQRVTPEVQGWISRGSEFAVVVDPTGGTKCMSIALALVARRWPCTIRYVGGTARSKGGMGTVLDNHESLTDSINPLETLGYQDIEDALTLARQMNFEGAQQILRPGHSSFQPHTKSRIAALRNLLQFFAEWDRFDHDSALKKLPDVEKNLDALGQVLSETSLRSVRDSIPAWRQRLRRLGSNSPDGRPRSASAALVEDLFLNAQRRRDEGRYDDATARLYRAVEALAQWMLKEQHRIATGAVQREQLPAGFEYSSPRWPAKLGLQDAYRLLLALDNPVGKAFVNLGLVADDEHRGSPLLARNDSILAHGFTPMTREAFDALWKAADQLMESCGLAPGPQFPRLQARAVGRTV